MFTNGNGGGLGASTNTLTNQIWGYWQATAQTNSTSIWTNWISGLGAQQQAGGATTLQVWTTWIAQTNAGGVYSQPAPVAPTQEELTAQAERNREEREANERAARLLAEYLDEDQRKTWREQNVIDLVSERKKRYRIKRGISHNVEELDGDGRAVASLCAHPDGVPVDDVVLTQVLALKYAEDHFLKVANRRALAA